MKNVVALAIIFGAAAITEIAYAAETAHKRNFSSLDDQYKNERNAITAEILRTRQHVMIKDGLQKMRQRLNTIKRSHQQLEKTAGISPNSLSPFSSKILSKSTLPLSLSAETLKEQESSLPVQQAPSRKRKTPEVLSKQP